MKVELDLSPAQEPITKDRISEMIAWEPRRHMLSVSWQDCLHAPASQGGNWSVTIPFKETLVNSFPNIFVVKRIPFRASASGKCYYTYLKCDADDEEETIEKVKRWISDIGSHVAIRDCLALSFAVDYDREDGNPEKPQTKIGQLRAIAKTYGKVVDTKTFKAADELSNECVKLLRKISCYDYATCVVGMPPSKPEESYSITAYITKKVAEQIGKPDFTSYIKTVKARPELKNIPLEKKLEVIEGTVDINPDIFKNHSVLLIDDLYQSGVSMNYIAMLLLDAGAKKVFGLACEKTCTNDDNVS